MILSLCFLLTSQAAPDTYVKSLESVASEDRERIVMSLKNQFDIQTIFVPNRGKKPSPQIENLNFKLDPKVQEVYFDFWAMQRFVLYPGRFIAIGEVLSPKEKFENRPLRDQSLILIEESAPIETLYHLVLHYLQYKDGSLQKQNARQKELTEKFSDWEDSKKAYDAEPVNSPIKANREMGVVHLGLEYFLLRLDVILDDSEWKKDGVLARSFESLKISEEDRKRVLQRLEINLERRQEDFDLLKKDTSFVLYTSPEKRKDLNCPDVEKYFAKIQKTLPLVEASLKQQTEELKKWRGSK